MSAGEVFEVFVNLHFNIKPHRCFKPYLWTSTEGDLGVCNLQNFSFRKFELGET